MLRYVDYIIDLSETSFNIFNFHLNNDLVSKLAPSRHQTKHSKAENSKSIQFPIIWFVTHKNLEKFFHRFFKDRVSLG